MLKCLIQLRISGFIVFPKLSLHHCYFWDLRYSLLDFMICFRNFINAELNFTHEATTYFSIRFVIHPVLIQPHCILAIKISHWSVKLRKVLWRSFRLEWDPRRKMHEWYQMNLQSIGSCRKLGICWFLLPGLASFSI